MKCGQPRSDVIVVGNLPVQFIFDYMRQLLQAYRWLDCRTRLYRLLMFICGNSHRSMLIIMWDSPVQKNVYNRLTSIFLSWKIHIINLRPFFCPEKCLSLLYIHFSATKSQILPIPLKIYYYKRPTTKIILLSKWPARTNNWCISETTSQRF